MRILVIDANETTSQPVKQALERQDMDCALATDVSHAFELAISRIYDILIVTSKLPQMGTPDFIRRLRATMLPTPIIVFCAGSDSAERAALLDCGADEVITEVDEAVEIAAKARALMRRNPETLHCEVIKVKDTTLNISSYELSGTLGSVGLGAKEMQFAELLFRSSGKIVSKEAMIAKVWGQKNDTEYNNVEVYISLLRKKLRLVTDAVDIKTIRGIGYRLE